MIERGGTNEERLYLTDLEFFHNDKRVIVKKTDMPGIENIIYRHKARYSLVAFYARPGMRVLDFPCGSGYAYDMLKGVDYEGRDNDEFTIRYAQKHYNNSEKTFSVDDLTSPHLRNDYYDIIACIEGIEHIELAYQKPAIEKLFKAVKPGGILIVSCPAAPKKSGPSLTNTYHKGELTKTDFAKLMEEVDFDPVIITQKDILHNGEEAILLYGICHKEGE